MPLDPVIFAGMVFSVVVLVLIGGFVLLYPLTRRLGAFLESRLERGTGGADPREIEELRRAVLSLRNGLESLAERQDFVEGLLESPERELLRSAGGESRDRRAGSAPRGE